jgi:hypothetical protein
VFDRLPVLIIPKFAATDGDALALLADMRLSVTGQHAARQPGDPKISTSENISLLRVYNAGRPTMHRRQ